MTDMLMKFFFGMLMFTVLLQTAKSGLPRHLLDPPFTCPPVKGCKSNCNKQTDCEKGSEQCCRNKCGSGRCVLNPTPKIGECPSIETENINCVKDGKVECKVDRECQGWEKCCDKSCGGKACTIPQVPGCPYEPFVDDACIEPLINTCTADEDCENQQDCCINGCGIAMCMTVHSNKQEKNLNITVEAEDGYSEKRR